MENLGRTPSISQRQGRHGCMIGIEFSRTSNTVGICGGDNEPIAAVVFPIRSKIPSIHSMWVPRVADGGIFKDEFFCARWGEGCLVVLKNSVELCLRR